MIAEHRATRAIQRLVEYAPSSGGLALWVQHRDAPAEDEGAAVIRTDGVRLFYGEAFAALPLALQTGWVAHGVLHVALRHPQRLAALRALLGEVDEELFNTCADAIVNSALNHLGWLDLPKDAVTLPRLLADALKAAPDDETALLQWDVERLYRAIDDRRPRRGRPTRGGTQADEAGDGEREDGPRAAAVRALARPGARDLMPTAGERPEDAAEQAREWTQRLQRAHAGDGAFSILRTLLADLPQPRTPWEQVLRTLLARALAPQSGVSWSRPSRSWLANQGRVGGRRMPWEPGRSASRRVPRLVVMVDVSGSVESPLLERFAREVEALTRRLESRLVIVIGDERVRRVEHFEPGRSSLREIEFEGGGGTDFTPLLQEAARHDPDIGIFLTDLDGPAGWQPRWPVVWAVPEDAAHRAAPFGRRLVLR